MTEPSGVNLTDPVNTHAPYADDNPSPVNNNDPRADAADWALAEHGLAVGDWAEVILRQPAGTFVHRGEVSPRTTSTVLVLAQRDGQHPAIPWDNVGSITTRPEPLPTHPAEE